MGCIMPPMSYFFIAVASMRSCSGPMYRWSVNRDLLDIIQWDRLRL